MTSTDNATVFIIDDDPLTSVELDQAGRGIALSSEAI
jgi:hypothetical protein